MLAKVHSAAVLGIDSYPIEIEVNAGWGQPAVIIVGLPDAAVKESRDRVKTAIENSGFKYVMGRTTINLAPASVPNEGRAGHRRASRPVVRPAVYSPCIRRAHQAPVVGQ